MLALVGVSLRACYRCYGWLDNRTCKVSRCFACLFGESHDILLSDHQLCKSTGTSRDGVELQGARRFQICWAVTFWTSLRAGANSHRCKLEQATRCVTYFMVSLFLRCVLCIACTCKSRCYFCQRTLFADTPTYSLYLQRIWISMYPARATMTPMSSPDFLS